MDSERLLLVANVSDCRGVEQSIGAREAYANLRQDLGFSSKPVLQHDTQLSTPVIGSTTASNLKLFYKRSAGKYL